MQDNGLYFCSTSPPLGTGLCSIDKGSLMKNTIGIRAEDKNRWERRAPLSPDHVAELCREHALKFIVEPTEKRIFKDRTYREAGADIGSMKEADVVLGVKEIPVDKLLPGKVYFYFSHTHKGQESGRETLQRHLALGTTLLDYEAVADRRNRRKIFFGRYAGYAGMLETLRALGQRLSWEGFPSPLARLRPPYEYESVEEAFGHLARLGDEIRQKGLPPGLRPVVVAFVGSGNVAKGAQEAFERLPYEEVFPEDLAELGEDRDRPRNLLYKVVIDRTRRAHRISDGGFDSEELRDHPERYISALDLYLPRITALVNGTYWEPGHPKLVTRAHLEALWASDPQPRLRVIGDITCDIDGGIEVNQRATDPGDPTYVYDVAAKTTLSGVAGPGPVIMAVDNLPCELSRDASEHFGDSLLTFLPALARCDWTQPIGELHLPDELRKAIIVHRGAFAPAFSHLAQELADA